MLKHFLLLILLLSTFNNAQTQNEQPVFKYPVYTVDFYFGSKYMSMDMSFTLDRAYQGKLYFAIGAGSTYSGGENPPGTSIDEPFSWFSQQKDFETKSYLVCGGIQYLTSEGFYYGGGIDYSTTKVYTVYKSNATGWDWNKHKEDKNEIGIYSTVGYFIPRSSIYFKFTGSSLRGLMLGIGFGI